MTEPPLVLSFPETHPQALAFGTAAGLAVAAIELHRFPDGESLVRVPTGLPPEVLLFRSLDHPNDKLVELLLATEAARGQGARRFHLVAPYLCYMRQDMAFHPGEAVSQHIVGQWLAQRFTSVLTVDAHLHRTARLDAAVPARHSRNLSAADPIRRWLAGTAPEPVLVGPDAESRQWVAEIADPLGYPRLIGTKERRGDREVEVRLPAADLRGRRVILLDDVASTGRTLVQAARAVAAAGATRIEALVTHALFVDDALERMAAAGIGRVVSTDSVPHATNAIALAPLLARGWQALATDDDEAAGQGRATGC